MFMMVRSYIAKYFRNTLLSGKQTLKKRSTLTVLRDTYILCPTFIRVLFAFHKLKQFIHLKRLFNILYHVSHI